MVNSGAVLKEAIVGMRRALKSQGFAGKGPTFCRKLDHGNTILLSLQRSVKSTHDRTEVTINYGVYSALIGARLQDDQSSAVDVAKAHWRKRLNEGGREKWLLVQAKDGPDDCTRAIVRAAESVLPDLLTHSTNAALRDEWLAGLSPGVGNMQRLLYASIIVNEIGPIERLRALLDELRAAVAGSIHESLVERQLARSGVRVE